MALMAPMRTMATPYATMPWRTSWARRATQNAARPYSAVARRAWPAGKSAMSSSPISLMLKMAPTSVPMLIVSADVKYLSIHSIGKQSVPSASRSARSRRPRVSANSPRTAKARATNHPLPSALMPTIRISSGGRLVATQPWTGGTMFDMSHSSGAVETVVRLSITSQNSAGSAMTASRKAAAGLGTAPPR